MHKPLCHHNIDNLGKVSVPPGTASKCRFNGRCLCSDDGSTAVSISTSLMAAMKHKLPVKILESGHGVLKLNWAGTNPTMWAHVSFINKTGVGLLRLELEPDAALRREIAVVGLNTGPAKGGDLRVKVFLPG